MKKIEKTTFKTTYELNSFIKRFKIKKKHIINIETIKGNSSYDSFFRIWYWE